MTLHRDPNYTDATMSRKSLSEMARILGRRGGRQRAVKVEADRRKEIARSGAKAKWAPLKSKAARARATEAARAARWRKKSRRKAKP